MGYESIAHEGERNSCFSKIQIVGQKYRDKTTLANKLDSAALVFKASAFCYKWAITYSLVVTQPIRI